jgi:hypothetical protein
LELGIQHSNLHTFQLDIHIVVLMDSIGFLGLGRHIYFGSDSRILGLGKAYSYHRKYLVGSCMFWSWHPIESLVLGKSIYRLGQFLEMGNIHTCGYLGSMVR